MTVLTGTVPKVHVLLDELENIVPPRNRKPATPFEDEPGQDSVPAGDEAQQTPPWEQPVNEILDKDTKEKVVTVGENGKLTVTLKEGVGFDASWIVIHGDNPTDIVEVIKDEDFTRLIQATKWAAEKLQEGYEAPAKGNYPSRTASSPQNGSQGQERPSWLGACEHGPRVHKSGVSKAGNAYELGQCPQEICDAQWKPKPRKY